MHKRPVRVLLIFARAFPLIGLFQRPPQFMLLIVTVFVAALFCRRAIRARLSQSRPMLTFWMCTLASGFLAEILAWSGHFAAGSKEPALLHPQLIPDLILATGFYSGWAAAWLVVSRFSGFSLKGVFWTTGILGVFFEQMGAVFMSMVSNFLINPLLAIGMAVYVWAVYGSIMGIGYLPSASRIGSTKQHKWYAYPSAFVLMYLLASLLTLLMASAFSAIGLMPDKKPIGQFPFW